MRYFLLIFAMATAAFGARAQEPEFEFVMPQLPVIKLCAVDEISQNPIPFVSISMEYADTIMSSTTDAKGLLHFTPRSFPLTLTANVDGMQETTYGIWEQPDGPLTILMTREPAEEKRKLSLSCF